MKRTIITLTALGVVAISTTACEVPEDGVTKTGKSTPRSEAVEAAKSYLDTMAFSREGLIDQLTSKAGNGFARKNAVYAVDHADADWNAEAVEAAKGYLDAMAFSRSGLVDQLESKAGSQFTHAQAVYAVGKVL